MVRISGRWWNVYKLIEENKTAIVKYESKEVHIDVLLYVGILFGFRGTKKISSDHNCTHLYTTLKLATTKLATNKAICLKTKNKNKSKMYL